MNNLLRYSINFALSAVFILGFRQFGWISFTNPPSLFTNITVNDFIIAGIIAMVLFIIGEILGFIYKIVRTIFFFIGCFISIIYFFVSGYIKLALTSYILYDWFSYRPDFIIVLLMVIIIGFVRLPHGEELSKDEKEFLQWKKSQKR